MLNKMSRINCNPIIKFGFNYVNKFVLNKIDIVEFFVLFFVFVLHL